MEWSCHAPAIAAKMRVKGNTLYEPVTPSIQLSIIGIKYTNAEQSRQNAFGIGLSVYVDAVAVTLRCMATRLGSRDAGKAVDDSQRKVH